MHVQEFAVGQNRTIVLYVSGDVGEMVDPVALWSAIAVDAQERAGRGWELLSTAAMPLRQMGTAGNILFQSGGQYSTQAAVAVVYALTTP